MMRFVYGTDFHGDTTKFDRILDYAIQEGVNIVHLGADILPKGEDMLKRQKAFTRAYLAGFYKRCANKGITVLASFGNDDAYTRKIFFRKYASLLDETPYQKDSYEFKAYNFVPIYPFSLRTACKLDSPGWVYTERPCPTMDVNDTGFFKIDDPDTYFKQKGTIQEDLQAIKGHNRLIMAIHTPPYGVGLDVCLDGREVGSPAVLDWVKFEKPLLLLCGHIHESPDITGKWKAHIGPTTVIQPGPNMVDIRILASGNITSERIKL